VCTSLVVHGKIIAALGVKGPPHLIVHALGSSSASAPSHSPVQQLGTVYLTLYEALNLLTLTKDYLNPFYFQSHTLAFHFQLQHVIPLPSGADPGGLYRDEAPPRRLESAFFAVPFLFWR